MAGECPDMNDWLSVAIEAALPHGLAFNGEGAVGRGLGNEDTVAPRDGVPAADPVAGRGYRRSVVGTDVVRGQPADELALAGEIPGAGPAIRLLADQQLVTIHQIGASDAGFLLRAANRVIAEMHGLICIGYNLRMPYRAGEGRKEAIAAGIRLDGLR